MAEEYIRRDAAMKAVASQYGACRSPAQNRLLDEIRNKIRRAPAADVTPVVHGRWRDNGIAGSVLVKCSVCGFDCGASSFFYCPNCGAKMDGGTEK